MNINEIQIESPHLKKEAFFYKWSTRSKVMLKHTFQEKYKPVMWLPFLEVD